MKRRFTFEDLSSDEFEALVRHICCDVLGTGTIVFAPGPDGGRDATFNGIAQRFPSEMSPRSGKFIIQAKHTSNPVASCSDAEFGKVLDAEKPKLAGLIAANEVDHYLVFTNRKKPANKTIAKEKDLETLGLKTANILGIEQLESWLIANPSIWDNLGFNRFDKRFTLNADDLIEVIQAFHAGLKVPATAPPALPAFSYFPKAKKNKLNQLSAAYYEYMKKNSLPHFAAIEDFLKNPRNETYKSLYEDTAYEVKGKIIAHSGSFDRFDQALTYVADLITGDGAALAGKRRFVLVFLHYMYFTCDIGQDAKTSKAS